MVYRRGGEMIFRKKRKMKLRHIAFNVRVINNQEHKCIECGRMYTLKAGEIIRSRSFNLEEPVCDICSGREAAR